MFPTRRSSNRGGPDGGDSGEPEVQYLHPALFGHHDVPGLEISMHDAALVGSAERFGQRECDGKESAPPQAARHDHLGECLSFDELHRQKVDPFSLFN